MNSRAFAAELATIEDRAGLVFPGAADWLARDERDEPDDRTGSMFGELALDAQPLLVTTPNAGIPAYLTTYIDPKFIEVFTTPNNAAKIYGETRKGNWLDETAMFGVIESTGFVSTYGDFNNNGRAGVNWNYVFRQSYLYQVFTEWGERQIERAGRGRVDLAARLNIASAIVMDKFQNNMYFNGVAGMQNYGGLNDPSLSASLTPGTKAAGGTSWRNALPTEILADIQALWAQLQTQTGSNLEMDTPLTLGLHSISESYLMNTNSFGLTALAMIKKVFPNLKIQQAPQYLTGTTYSAQLIVDSINGQPTTEGAFNEKMRAHRLVMYESSARQKKTGGGWGTIIYNPTAVTNIAGI